MELGLGGSHPHGFKGHTAAPGRGLPWGGVHGGEEGRSLHLAPWEHQAQDWEHEREGGAGWGVVSEEGLGEFRG